jgi:histidine triad (HIT) family protein
MCLFCKIINKEIPSDIVYENDDVLCFRDIQPAAPIHVLIVPKKHFDSILDLSETDEGLKANEAVLKAVAEVAKITGCEDGFRLINNCGADGGQTVMHVHFHLLGGVKLNARIL